MRILALLLLVGSAAVAQAQPSRSYTPENPPRPDEETVLNARLVAVDATASRITVRGVDVKADGKRDESFAVAGSAASQLRDLKPGMEVLLTLRGTTVVGMKVSVVSGGPGGNVVRGTAAGSAKTAKTKSPGRASGTGSVSAPRTPVTPAPGAPPSPPATAPVVTGGAAVTTRSATGGVVPLIGAPSVPHSTPFPTPNPVGSPPAVGTPVPVLLPSEPPSPLTPTPTPSPVTN